MVPVTLQRSHWVIPISHISKLNPYKLSLGLNAGATSGGGAAPIIRIQSIFALLLGQIRIHYLAYYSDQIKYNVWIEYSGTALLKLSILSKTAMKASSNHFQSNYTSFQTCWHDNMQLRQKLSRTLFTTTNGRYLVVMCTYGYNHREQQSSMQI